MTGTWVGLGVSLGLSSIPFRVSSSTRLVDASCPCGVGRFDSSTGYTFTYKSVDTSTLYPRTCSNATSARRIL